jgi:mycothiol synthase
MSQALPVEIDIRVYKPTDEDALDAIIRAAFADGEISGWESYEIDNMVRGIGSTPETTFVALAADRIVGFLATDYSMLVVTPAMRRQGIGRRLVAAGLAKHPDLELAPPVGGDLGEPFLRAVGFAPHHLLWQLILQNGTLIDKPETPAGFVLRTFREDDFPQYHALLNRAFSDHPTPMHVSEERMQSVHERSDFDPTLIVLLAPEEQPDDPVAFSFVRLRLGDEETMKGGIGMLGVDREYRNRGFGRLLLRWGIWRLQSAGCSTIELEVVDSNNRALPLYESEGFTAVRSWPYWAVAGTQST